ncbi:MAG: leucyl/phenylalanyl-tRNA--protein transferase [Desulfovibrio sp.]|nr:leucyl/phenylalanyl-tRNA--protein transferase [Desulfovibrio sp.]
MIAAFSRLAALFPDVASAPADAPLCKGGDLGPVRLLAAYSQGIFPWYGPGLPILWWSPDPRCVLPLENFHLPRRSARSLRAAPFRLTLDAAFGRVISACAGPRPGPEPPGTWITPEMLTAYERLHSYGYAHSVEAWRGEELVGGLYGVALGRAFFGESMFHTQSEASRAALAGLVGLLRRRGATLLDCQQATPHMLRMGARLVPRSEFLRKLAAALAPGNGKAPPEDDPDEPRLCPWAPWRERYVFRGPCGDASPDSWEERS